MVKPAPCALSASLCFPALQKALVLPPKDQLKLDPEELEEDVSVTLTSIDPSCPKSVARLHLVFADRLRNTFQFQYKNEPSVSQTKFHFELDGYLAHCSSAEGRRQAQLDESKIRAKEREETERREYLLSMGGLGSLTSEYAEPDLDPALLSKFEYVSAAFQTRSISTRVHLYFFVFSS